MEKALQAISESPALIRESERKILQHRNSIAVLKEKLIKIKRFTMAEVTAENDNGKKIYSNTESRETETEVRLCANEEYQNLLSQLAAVENDMGNEEIDLKYYKDVFSSTRYKVKMLTAAKLDNAATTFCGGLQIIFQLSQIISAAAINPSVSAQNVEKAPWE